MKTHSGEKLFKFKIDLCKKHFAEKGDMKTHSKRHIKRLLKETERNECVVWEGSSTGECSSDDIKRSKDDKIVDLYETESEDNDEKENVLSIKY
jgi:hypothetical protein